jgi:hypothetical protein
VVLPSNSFAPQHQPTEEGGENHQDAVAGPLSLQRFHR